MTNEEAIAYGKECLSWNQFSKDMKMYQFIEMAIKALSQEPCDDAISREAVCDYIAEFVNNEYSTQAECEMVDFMIEGIQHLPSVTQKSGKWIYDETLENWRCSKCNETPKTMGYVGTADFMAEHFKFCNHCGAKMESEDKA